MLRENNSRYRLEPVGASLGTGLAWESRKMPISLIDNPMASVELLSSRQMFWVSITLIVSCGDDFTPIAQMQPFQSLFSKTNETMNYLAISKHKSEPTYKFGETGDNA